MINLYSQKLTMKNLLFLSVLFFAVNAWAGDRWGNPRGEITRSSYTESNNDVNVLVSSASKYWQDTLSLGGDIIVRSVILSGVNPSTITFYDTISFTNATTTESKVFFPGIANNVPVEVPVNLHISSGFMYSKTEGTPSRGVQAIFKWDYLIPPNGGGIGR